MIALASGQFSWFQAEHGHHVVAKDEDRAIGPTEPLFFVIEKGVRHQPFAEAVGGIAGRITLFKDAQAKLRILSNAPFSPATHLVEHFASDHGHGAVLNDGVALVTGDHANLKEAAIFGETHGLEGILVAIAVVLRGLDNGHILIGKLGNEGTEPIRLNDIITVDDRHYFGLRCCFPERIVERPCFKAGERINMEEAETRAQGPAMCLHRLPDGRIFGVVVNDQHLKPRIIKGGQGVDRFNHHVRRFVVGRHMDGNHGQVIIGNGSRCRGLR